MKEHASPATRSRLPPIAIFLLFLVCAIWGGNFVAIKISNQGIPPLLAATLRSVVGATLLWIYATLQGERVLFPRQDLRHAVIIGVFFALDFLLLYGGLTYTNASRGIIFLYTHPFWVALGAHLLLSDDRLSLVKGGGLVLAFGGLVAVYGARSGDLDPRYWLGDTMEMGSAFFWAATTLYVKRVVEKRDLTPHQTLFAQLLYSIPLLAVASLLFERGYTLSLTAPVLGAFAYQCVGVAFLSYLLWFWMIHRFTVSRLAAFTFLAPLFGVILGGLLLQESLPLPLWVGLALVGAGIFLVNR